MNMNCNINVIKKIMTNVDLDKQKMIYLLRRNIKKIMEKTKEM